MINVLIIEDEKISGEFLNKLLRKSKVDIFVMGILSGVEETLKWLISNPFPDLIFMDIHLSDGISFQLFEKINIKIPVIFTTAYENYAIRAFKTTGIDYLMKPLDLMRVESALIKYYENKLIYYNNNSRLEVDEITYSTKGFKERFLVNQGNKYIPIKTDNIAYIFRQENFIFIKLFDSKSYIVNFSLNQLEEVLPPSLYIRLNRSIIANINSIEDISRSKRVYTVNLIPKHQEVIQVSKERYSELKNFLSGEC